MQSWENGLNSWDFYFGFHIYIWGMFRVVPSPSSNLQVVMLQWNYALFLMRKSHFEIGGEIKIFLEVALSWASVTFGAFVLSIFGEEIISHQWCSGNILAFQAGAPGSIPGWCRLFLTWQLHSLPCRLLHFHACTCTILRPGLIPWCSSFYFFTLACGATGPARFRQQSPFLGHEALCFEGKKIIIKFWQTFLLLLNEAALREWIKFMWFLRCFSHTYLGYV